MFSKSFILMAGEQFIVFWRTRIRLKTLLERYFSIKFMTSVAMKKIHEFLLLRIEIGSYP